MKATEKFWLKWDRQPMFENEMCESVGLMATCNSCDRIIFADENWMEGYQDSAGYCRECLEECNATIIQDIIKQQQP